MYRDIYVCIIIYIYIVRSDDLGLTPSSDLGQCGHRILRHHYHTNYKIHIVPTVTHISYHDVGF